MYLTAEGQGCAMHQPSSGLGFSNTAAWRGLSGYYVMKKYVLGKVPLTCGNKGSLNDGHHSQTFIGQGECVGRPPVQDCVPTWLGTKSSPIQVPGQSVGPAYDGQMYFTVQQATRGLQQVVLRAEDTGCGLSHPAGLGSSQQLFESPILHPVQDAGCDNATEGSCNGNSTGMAYQGKVSEAREHVGGTTYSHLKEQTCNVGDVQSTRTKEKLQVKSVRPGLCLYPGQLFLILTSIWPSETRYQCIVKICHLSGEFTGVDFSRDKASVTARLKPMNQERLLCEQTLLMSWQVLD